MKEGGIREARQDLSALIEDVKTRPHRVLVPAARREAERLLVSLGTVPLRAADALHLALALGAEAASLLTTDRRLGAAARAVGLGVFPLRV